MEDTKDMAIERGGKVEIPGIDKPFPSLPGPKKRREGQQGLSRAARNAIIVVGSLAALGAAAGYAAHKDIPGQVAEWFTGIGEKSIEEKFPIALPQDKFTPVTPEEEKKLWENTKTLDLEKHILVIGSPFNQETIARNPGIRTDQQFDAILPPFIDGEKLKQEGVENVISFTGLSKGDKFILNYDNSKYDASIITVSIAGETQRGSFDSFTAAYTTFRVIFKDKQTNKSDVWQSIGGLYAKPLVTNRSFPSDHNPVYEDGVPVESGGSILELTTDLQDWDGKNQILPGQKGQFIVRSGFQQENPMAPIPLTANLLRASNGNIASTHSTQ